LGRAQSLGFLGDVDLDDQIEHALGFAHAVEHVRSESAVTARTDDPPGLWMDLGSGGGLPGLVIAQRWETSRAVLLDANLRRTEFLSDVVHELGWDERVEVSRARAEDAGRDPRLRAGFETVLARSFGAPAVVAECAAPLLVVGGVLVVSEPPARAGEPTNADPGDEAPDSVRWPPSELAELGLVPCRVIRARFSYQVLEQVAPCPDRYPRRAGIPSKRPLYR
jgi:16S rRNA (guanine527-N7)-methyltransferase